MPQRRLSPEVPDWSAVGRKPAKAGLPEKPASEFGVKLWDVLVHAHGGAKEAAYTMGIDRSLLRRKVLDLSLTLEELLTAKPEALAEVGELFADTFGDRTKSRTDLAREKLKDALLAILDLTAEAK